MLTTLLEPGALPIVNPLPPASGEYHVPAVRFITPGPAVPRTPFIVTLPNCNLAFGAFQFSVALPMFRGPLT